MASSPDWLPSRELVAAAQLTRFATKASARAGRDLAGGYGDLWRWSVEEPEEFSALVWDEVGMPPRDAAAPVLADDAMPGATWFPGVRLIYALEAFRGRTGSDVAVIAVDETDAVHHITWAELRSRVASFAASLAELGVGPGDRVVGYLPNRLEAVVAFLGTVSLGAIWSMCGLDYAAPAASARFAQLDPTVLVAGVRATVAGRVVDRAGDLTILRASLPTLKATIVVGAQEDSGLDATAWEETQRRLDASLPDVAVPFDHPLWVLFSSGTTGVPKGIVHGHGGVVLELRKHSMLHLDLRPGDRVFWYTSPSWMIWNFLVSNLLLGCTIVCYDGSPAHPGPDRLWQLAARHEAAVLGTSPGYLAACRKAGVTPSSHDLTRLRVLGVTGSTFAADLHRWAIEQVPGAQVVSSSGGTDVATAFASSAPTTPVWAGELSAPCLGVALDAFDDTGRPVRGQLGELVVTRPMPSMPTAFWNDPDGARLRAAYFDHFPGVWRHGDWITLTDHGSVVIHGRSDATLNRNGVRMGSGDIYAAVERLPEVTESLVVGIERPGGGYWMPLFVQPAPGIHVDDDLRDRIRSSIRAHASPRHVPDEIIEVPAVPHTRTGKKLEVPVKRILLGEDPHTVCDPQSVDDPGLLPWYAELRDRHGDSPAR